MLLEQLTDGITFRFNRAKPGARLFQKKGEVLEWVGVETDSGIVYFHLSRTAPEWAQWAKEPVTVI